MYIYIYIGALDLRQLLGAEQPPGLDHDRVRLLRQRKALDVNHVMIATIRIIFIIIYMFIIVSISIIIIIIIISSSSSSSSSSGIVTIEFASCDSGKSSSAI